MINEYFIIKKPSVSVKPISRAIEFVLSPIEMKPSRMYRKGSKYDPILDAFMESTECLVEVTVPDKDAHYLRTQLNKRIKAKRLKVKTSVINNVLYLEKV